MSKPKRESIRSFLVLDNDRAKYIWFTVMVTGLLISGIYFFIRAKMGSEYPLNTPFFHPSDRFMDFFNVNSMTGKMNPYGEFGSNYPPFGLLVGHGFSLLYDAGVSPEIVRRSVAARAALICLFCSAVCAIALLVFDLLRTYSFGERVAVVALLCVSYPVLFMFDRGNYLCLALLAITLYTLTHERYPKFSGFCLALACSLKIYLGIFVFIFFLERRYREVWQTLGFILFLNLSALLCFEGSILKNISVMLKQILLYTNGVLFEGIGVSFQNSILAPIRLLSQFGYIEVQFESWLSILAVGTTFSLMIAGLFGAEDFERRFKILTLFMIVIQPMSPDYNLVFLIIPTVWVLRRPEQSNWVELSLLSSLLIFKGYWVLFYSGLHYYATVQSAINPVILVALLVLNLPRRKIKQVVPV